MSELGTEGKGGSRVGRWFLLGGDRRLIAAGISLAIGLVVYGLIWQDLLIIGGGSMLPTLLGSGITSGLLTLITVALSINQLILSRVFDTPDALVDTLEGTLDMRSNVEDIADAASSPNQPAHFLGFLGDALGERVDALRRELDTSDEGVDAYLDAMTGYAAALSAASDEDEETTDLLSSLFGPGYARNLTATHHLRRSREADLSETATDHLDAVSELMKAVAVMRQFFKTIAIQQDLAHLSRLIIYSGLTALTVTIALTLSYTSSSLALPAVGSAEIISFGMAVIVLPLALLSSYMIRVATVSMYSVSVGPFVPPESSASE